MPQKRTPKNKKSFTGVFVTFEGVEGSGKSTQIQKAYEWLRSRLPDREILLTREPGGTPLADRIREKLLTISSRIDPETELFLYEAARRDHVEDVLRPALRRKAIILCDRFTDSTVAYQGYGRGLPVARIVALNRIASGGLLPHLTFLFDLPVTEGLRRARSRSRAMDRIDLESKRFHERVRQGFLSLARQDKNRFKVLDARRSPEAIFHDVSRNLGRALEKKI